MKKIEITPSFEKALHFLEDPSTSCFITGRAGTGKSTLLKYFIDQTKKNVAVLAPTGIAAVNVGGQTVHSFFGFKPNVTLDAAQKLGRKILKAEGKNSLYHQVDAIVVDEVSMLRADLADCMDLFLRTVREDNQTPFGGIKMVFIGDLYQLPPVVISTEREIFSEVYPTPYFFGAHVFRDFSYEMIELEKIYRQTDDTFIGLLNKIRNNSVDDADLRSLNTRVGTTPSTGKGTLSVFLTPTNAKAAELNAQKLNVLTGDEKIFRAEIEGNCDKSSYPTDDILSLKKGAQVMLLNNDSLGRWVNGTLAEVTGFLENVIEVKLENGMKEEVGPFGWEIFRYDYDVSKKKLTTETVGKFTQYPLKLAWALTIHKSQGKTFDHVTLDLDRGTFAPGQLYVALSRCRSFEGLFLTKPVKKGHVFLNYDVVRFMIEHHYAKSEKQMPLEEKMALIEKAIAKKIDLEMLYLKGSDEKSNRTITPITVGPMSYAGKTFPGLRAFCKTRKAEQTFRVDRILELRMAE